MYEPNNEYLSGVGISSRKYKRLLLSIECKLKEILSEIDINASASKTWDVLTDFKNFPQWNPFIRQIDGTPNVGARAQNISSYLRWKE